MKTIQRHVKALAIKIGVLPQPKIDLGLFSLLHHDTIKAILQNELDVIDIKNISELNKNNRNVIFND